ncbi:RICIN domain-containing protein [Streptomyces nitrosporeus]|uniref:RICIN domain-containing protein n=1 Tax=Streptomyces nitrosporeus TaxID=28894 RepID=UPI0033254694
MSGTLRAALATGVGLAALIGGAAPVHADQHASSEILMTVQLQVKYKSKCLSVANGSLANGAHVVEADCDSSAENQIFGLRDAASGWEIVAKHSGRCVTYSPTGTAGAVQRWCNGSSDQQWSMSFIEDEAEPNRLTLRPDDAPDECLSMGGTPAGEEPVAYVMDCFDDLPSQEWKLLFI